MGSDVSKILTMFKERDVIKAIKNTLVVIGKMNKESDLSLSLSDQIDILVEQFGLSEGTKIDIRMRLMNSILKDED